MELSTALTLLLIGMITVFVVLLLVVLVGNLLILFVNRFLPVDSEGNSPKGEASAKQVAVLAATVEVVTEGRGTITNIKKLK